jgi:hypothetical protein
MARIGYLSPGNPGEADSPYLTQFKLGTGLAPSEVAVIHTAGMSDGAVANAANALVNGDGNLRLLVASSTRLGRIARGAHGTARSCRVLVIGTFDTDLADANTEVFPNHAGPIRFQPADERIDLLHARRPDINTVAVIYNRGNPGKVEEFNHLRGAKGPSIGVTVSDAGITDPSGIPAAIGVALGSGAIMVLGDPLIVRQRDAILAEWNRRCTEGGGDIRPSVGDGNEFRISGYTLTSGHDRTAHYRAAGARARALVGP